jgi:hypothetical protein
VLKITDQDFWFLLGLWQQMALANPIWDAGHAKRRAANPGCMFIAAWLLPVHSATFPIIFVPSFASALQVFSSWNTKEWRDYTQVQDY